MARVFVSRRLPGGALDRLAAAGNDVTVWQERLPPSREQLVAGVTDADGLLSLLTDRVDASLLDSAPALRAIANYAVGVDNIDLDAATARGIPVGNTPDVLTDATADLAWTLLLAAARRLPDAIAAARAGDWLTWEPGSYLGASVYGASLGVIGYGRIGRAVAARAAGFSMTVLHTGNASLDEILERSDFVSLHTPLTPATRGLIDAAALARMKSTAILINTARGPIVDQVALADALGHGRDRRRRAGRHRSRAAAERRSAVGSAELDRRAAHRLGDACGTRADGQPGRRQPARRTRRHADAAPGERAVSRVAVVDIGSNSTRLLLCAVDDGRVVDELDRRSEVTRLGAGVDSAGRLADDAIDRVFAVLDQYRRAIDGADRAIAVLTSAVRDASNGGEFATEVQRRYGLEPHVLKGDDEARLTFLGATSERDPDDRTPTLVVDIGGGSTELVIGTGHEMGFHVSTQAGVVRQTERHLHSDPPTEAELGALADDVRAIFAAAVPEAVRAGVGHAIAVAGTATQLAAIAQRLEPYDAARVHGYVLTDGERERILGELAAVPLAERERTPGLDPARAPTIVAGAAILGEVLHTFGLVAVEVSEHDILRGAALGLS